MADDFAFGADAVPDLSLDFSKWGGQGKTAIPDPSTDTLAQFFADIGRHQAANARIEDEPVPDDETPEQRDQRIERTIARGQELGLKNVRARAEIYAAVIGNVADADALMALPNRVREAFFGYVLGAFSPNA